MARQARQTRPQLVCVLADNSISMAGDKAKAASQGIQEMIMECQARGPAGPDRSYFKLLLIRFDGNAVIDPLGDMTPVRKIDPDRIQLTGDGSGTNITAALKMASGRLRSYIQELQLHAERAEHPLPLVIIFSDGEHNVGEPPLAAATEIKQLNLDGEPIVIAAAGVAIGGDQPDEKTLREIASPECYVHIANASALAAFISSVGSSGASRAKDVADAIKKMEQ